MRLFNSLCVLSVFALYGPPQSFAQNTLSVAKSVQFASATGSDNATVLKIRYNTFIPLFAKTDKPTEFFIYPPEAKSAISTITLPKESPFGGEQFDQVGVRGWTFPEAKSDVLIVLGNNTTKQTVKLTVFVWENVGEKQKPVNTGFLNLEILPKGNSDTKPVDDDKKIDDPPITDPVKYKGKWNLLVLEKSEEATKQRGLFFQDKTLRSFLSDKLSDAPRVVDVPISGKLPSDLMDYYERYKKSGSSMPYFFIVSDDGVLLLQGTIPSTMSPAQYIEVLKKIPSPK